MISLENINKNFGAQTILNHASLVIHPGEKIGLVGPNGVGKTTLLRIIESLEEVDSGRVGRQDHVRIGALRQELASSDRTILQETLQGDRELTRLREEHGQIQQKLAEVSGTTEEAHQRLVARWGEVEHRLEAVGSYEAESRAARILMGLGFGQEALDQPLSAFSGGWRMRVALAQLLFSQPDLLLLDEPTNHLDMESVAWFENHLRHMPQTFLAVSHDRGFLNRVTQVTVELYGGALSRFQGAFDAYIEQKAIRFEQQENQRLQQGRRVEAMTRFINRFRAQATKARQVQSRVKQLQKIEILEQPDSRSAVVRIRLPEPKRSALKMLSVHGLSKRFGDNTIFSDAKFECQRGEKIGLLGPNGAGKTTFLKLLAGVLPPDHGEVLLGDRVQTAYFTQHAMDALDPEETLLAQACDAASRDVNETAVRTLLGGFLFTGDEVFKKVSVLSGGERARLALLRMFLSGANLLLLDEPTNHLDMESRAALSDALESYRGSLLLVTHDRDLMQAVCNRFCVVSGGQLTLVEGDLSSYLDRVALAREETSSSGWKRTEPRKGSRERKRQATRDREQLKIAAKPLRQRVGRLEVRIQQLEGEQAALTQSLAGSDLYQASHKEQLKETLERNRQVTLDLAKTLAEWEKVSLSIERLLQAGP